MPASRPNNFPENVSGNSHLPRASGKFLSHVLTLITGNGLAQVINVVGTLLLARLFAPDAFGSFALFVTVVSFLAVLGRRALRTGYHAAGKRFGGRKRSSSFPDDAVRNLRTFPIRSGAVSFRSSPIVGGCQAGALALGNANRPVSKFPLFSIGRLVRTNEAVPDDGGCPRLPVPGDYLVPAWAF